jgi:hypothetical protein
MPRSWKLPDSMSRGLRAAAYLATAFAGVLLATAGGARAGQQNQYSLFQQVQITGTAAPFPCGTAASLASLAKFDISWTDARDSLYLLADRTNASLDVFDANTNTCLFVVPGFAGQQASNDTSGPDGVLTVANRYAYVGDGNSTVKIIDLVSQQVIDTVTTGPTGDNRADEMVYDPRDNLVMVANDAPTLPTVPFVSFISTIPDNTGHHNVVGTISFPDACNSATNPTVCNGLEQSVWSNRTGLIYISVPIVGAGTTGEIAIINPRSRTIVGAFPIGCQPAGLAIGPKLNAVVGCSDTSGPNKEILIISLNNGNQVARLTSFNGILLNGADEVWYNPTTQQYFVAGGSATNNGNAAQPILTIIDATRNQVTQTIATSVGDHSVAVDPVRDHVFLPDTGTGKLDVFHLLGEDVAAN